MLLRKFLMKKILVALLLFYGIVNAQNESTISDKKNNETGITIIVIHSIDVPLSIINEFSKRDYVKLLEFNDEEIFIGDLEKIFR